MDEVVSIAPVAGEPGLTAYECPKCGYVTSVLQQPKAPALARRAQRHCECWRAGRTQPNKQYFTRSPGQINCCGRNTVNFDGRCIVGCNLLPLSGLLRRDVTKGIIS
jgi:hypothetical protein